MTIKILFSTVSKLCHDNHDAGNDDDDDDDDDYDCDDEGA